jgi:hypothetical protein
MHASEKIDLIEPHFAAHMLKPIILTKPTVKLNVIILDIGRARTS